MDPLSFAGGLATGALGLLGLNRLREHRTRPAGLSDLLLWAFLVERHTVLLKTGAFLTSWRFRGPDSAASSPAELEQLTRQVSDALLPLGDGWMLHVDAIRRPAVAYPPCGSFPDPLTRLLDEERRRSSAQLGNRFETDAFLTLTHLPPPDVYARAGRLFVTGPARQQPGWETHLERFEGQAQELARRLSSVLRLERLGEDDLLGFLHTCLTGLHHPVRMPGTPAYLDQLLASQDFVTGYAPRMGEKHLRLIAVHGFPPETEPALLEHLAELGVPLRISHRLVLLSPQTAARTIGRTRRLWNRKRSGAQIFLPRGSNPAPDRAEVDRLFEDADAHAMLRDASAAAAANASGALAFALYTPVVVLHSDSAAEAEAATAEVLRALEDRGLPARVEAVNAVAAFLGSLPGHGENLRRPPVGSKNLADLLPLTSVWPGEAVHPSPLFPRASPPLLYASTQGSTPFRLHLHVGDVGHTLIVGPTGAGKSTLVGLLAAQFLRYPNSQVFLFDVGHSARILAHASGAAHYDFAAGGTVDAIALHPLAEIHRPTELPWALGWLELVFSLQDVALTPASREAIHQALVLLAAEASEHRTLTDLRIQLQRSDLQEALAPYLETGPYGRLLDSPTDHLGTLSKRFHVFELRALMDLSPKILLPVLSYLFRAVERRLTGRPTLIVVEEAWLPLLEPRFRARLKQWLLTLRKQNAAVVLVTQSLAQLAGADSSEILDSCPVRLLLPNPEATTPGNRALYQGIGLTDSEIALLAGARRKRDYLYRSPLGTRIFDLGLGPAQLAFLSSPEGLTPQQAFAAVETLEGHHGRAWPARWLEERGLPEWAALYLDYLGEMP